MDPSFFSSQVQAILSRLLVDWLGQSAPTKEAPKATWVHPTPKYSGAGDAGAFEDLIRQAAEKYGVDANLVRSVIRAESNFNPKAVSSAGARGLMQLMPATAAGLGVGDSFNPQENINGGVKLLSRLLRKYDGDVRLALAAYNAGPGAVARYGGVPPYQETRT